MRLKDFSVKAINIFRVYPQMTFLSNNYSVRWEEPLRKKLLKSIFSLKKLFIL